MRITSLLLIALSQSLPALGYAAAAQDVRTVPQNTAAPGSLLANGGFEDGLSGWEPFWCRATGTGQAVLDQAVVHEGKCSLRIDHKGQQDWSLAATRSIDVRPGELYSFSGWLRLEGEGRAEISAILRDAAGQVIDWSYAARTTTATPGWRAIHGRFLIPPRARTMTPRVIGYGPAVVHVDGLSLERREAPELARAANLPPRLDLTTDQLGVSFETEHGTLSVRDARTGQSWAQRPRGSEVMVTRATFTFGAIEAHLVDPRSTLAYAIKIAPDPALAELVVELTGPEDMNQDLAFPYPFQSDRGSFLVMPVNEGISYPVDDPALPEMAYHLYGGHGLCMPWWGVTDGNRGMMAIVETPDDAAVQVPRLNGRLCLAPRWEPQKGRFGPPRRIRYVFFDRGGYVAMAKRYRHYSQAVGLLKTLAQKRAENPNVDRLIGAVNVWCWDGRPVEVVRDLKSAGIERILWSGGANPDQLQALNALGVLTSRYDIYQDVMDPANFSKLGHVHPDWTTKAWPADLMIDATGQWIRGWEVKGRDGKMYPCGVTCDRQAIPFAEERIAAELKTHPYQCRFIDTTTAAPWRECHDPSHPVTRTESRHWKMELLRLISEQFKLVTGSETGHDAAVPFVHYFEGMLSLGPYRVDDAGRDMARILADVPPQIEKFQTGPFYRLPLWELVYHDCVVSQWYWGDYNNKIPAVWDRRDLYNALYGTPPMFMFDRRLWRKERERFVKSYRTVCPIARETGYSEMLSHHWLSADHAVQETRFANGLSVVVNLGKDPFSLDDGSKLQGLGLRVTRRHSTPAAAP